MWGLAPCPSPSHLYPHLEAKPTTPSSSEERHPRSPGDQGTGIGATTHPGLLSFGVLDKASGQGWSRALLGPSWEDSKR